MTERTKKICISLDKKVLAAVDADRHSIPRSSYINDILFYALASEEELKGLANFSQK